MNVDVRIRGKDHRLYPAVRAGEAERLRVAGAVHQLRCAEMLSLRMVQEQLAERYGARRSVGSIVTDLKRWRCEHCRTRTDAA